MENLKKLDKLMGENYEVKILPKVESGWIHLGR